jgi:hypothetical protein
MLASEILTAARDKLLEAAESFFDDDELLRDLNLGVKDLWRAISDNFQDYFFDTDEAVTQTASATTLSNVPTDVAKVLGIEPVSLSSYPSLKYFPKKYNSAEMQAARGVDAQDPASAGPIFYAVTGAGGPVGAPTIHVAPKVSATVALRLIYTPTTPALIVSSPNPIPGESDAALIAWVIAHALGRDNEDKKPDPDWMALYATEKTNILTFLTPRQEDEPDVAEALFEPWTDG